MSQPRPAECLEGDEALARGAWAEARALFEAVLRADELPEALEGLATAAWWLDLAEVVFDARERAYRLFLARDDRLGAARIAVWLAWDAWAFRGEGAVANGWLGRARRLLDGLPDSVELAWLEVREGSLCLLEEGDPQRALAMADEGIRVARKAGSLDMEMLGRAVRGLALVTAGSVQEGMRCLDEVNAAVIAGELTDLVAIGLSSCYLIAACERVRDYDRAVQWCKRLKIFCTQWGLRPLLAVCRTQYASICLWRGIWDEAEQELCSASEELAASRPAMTGDALVRLADLRRRQGRLEEAAAIFEKVVPASSGLLGRAELALDRGDARAAGEQAERYLRHVPAQNRPDRAAALEILVRALALQQEWERAKTALAELKNIAAEVGTMPLRAAASYASGCVALGQGKTDAGRQCFEDALDLFRASGAPFEVARSRIELARTLGMMGRTDAALEEARSAMEAFSQLHAVQEEARARQVVEALAESPAQAAAKDGADTTAGLTRREMEVLRLVAEGLSNQSIGKRLFVSDHTVHRHLANILGKLGVSTRAAAVAQAARRGLL
ncbi:MAG: LuxR C-terminal-related transcriptional regulator [Acidobacteriaceae bacterium]